MFPPKSMKSVTRGIRNLPDDSTNAAATDAPATGSGLTCPSCGASFDLQAVSKPSAEPPAPDPSQAQQAPASGNGPGF